MLTHFPKAVPEIPVSNVEKAAEYYVNALGFHLDWCNDQDGIGGYLAGGVPYVLDEFTIPPIPRRQRDGRGLAESNAASLTEGG